MRIPQSLWSMTIAGAVALTALPVVTVLTADAAWANPKETRHDDGPGNSENAPGQNRDDDDRPGNGSVARELGPLNAAHANVMALLNASPASNVGQIEVYRQEAADSVAAAQAVEAAEAAYLAELRGYDGRSSIVIEQEIFALDPQDADYQADLDALRNELDAALAHEDALRAFEGEVTDARDALEDAASEESEALLQLTGGEPLPVAAVTELRSLLGL